MTDFIHIPEFSDVSLHVLGVLCIACGAARLLPKIRFTSAVFSTALMIYTGMQEILGFVGSLALLTWVVSERNIKAGEVIFLQIMTFSIVSLSLSKLNVIYEYGFGNVAIIAAATFVGSAAWMNTRYSHLAIASGVISVAVFANSYYTIFAILVLSGSLFQILRRINVYKKEVIHE